MLPAVNHQQQVFRGRLLLNVEVPCMSVNCQETRRDVRKSRWRGGLCGAANQLGGTLCSPIYRWGKGMLASHQPFLARGGNNQHLAEQRRD